MVTDEMVEKAARCIEPDAFAILDGGDQWRIINSHHKREATRAKARAALEAALSGAEPVAWAWKGPKGGFLADDKKPSWPSTPLYAAPPAPSVAVKAQQAVWIKHDGKNMPVNAETIVEVRMASGFEYEADLAGNWLEREGSKSNWHHDLGCPHPCDIVAYHIVTNSPALSAQAQVVAGWQLVPKEATREQLSIVYEQVQNGEVDDRSWAELYAAFIAAAPAKQEG